MGGVAGGAALYFLGTQHGRERLRKILDLVENIDEDMIQELLHTAEPGDSTEKKTVPDMHSLLDKIQTVLPSSSDVQKFFAKDGKILK